MSRTTNSIESPVFWAAKNRARTTAPIFVQSRTPSLFHNGLVDEDSDFEVSPVGCIYRGPARKSRPGQVPHSTLFGHSLWTMSRPTYTAIQRASAHRADMMSEHDLAESYRVCRATDRFTMLTVTEKVPVGTIDRLNRSWWRTFGVGVLILGALVAQLVWLRDCGVL